MFTAASGRWFYMNMLLISAGTGLSSNPSVRTKTPSACPGGMDFLALLGGSAVGRTAGCGLRTQASSPGHQRRQE